VLADAGSSEEAAVDEAAEAALARGPLRRCLASGQVLPKAALLRFVVSPDGELLADPAGRLPGRGLWLQPDAAMIRRAQSRGLFAKAARAPVRVPDDLLDRLVALERRRLADLVGLARRAGLAVTGFEKVKAACLAGRVRLLLAARDGAAGGREKLAALLAGRLPGTPVVAALDAAELGRALGRDFAVHVAIAPGGLAERLLAAADRLQRLEGATPAPRATETQDSAPPPGAVER